LVARKTGCHPRYRGAGQAFSGSCSSPRCVGGVPLRVNSTRLPRTGGRTGPNSLCYESC